jgi:thiosulfate dehydrogenase [quinone] large subunit
MDKQTLQTTILGREFNLPLAGAMTGYWVLLLRLIVGWWFLQEGINKYVTPGTFRAGWFLEKDGTVVAPILNPLAGGATETMVNLIVPLGEVLIGLAIRFGAITRTAAFFGAIMTFFLYFGNEQWRRGMVNGELMGLFLFITIIVFGAGRVLGVDVILERTHLVETKPWLRYFLG